MVGMNVCVCLLSEKMRNELFACVWYECLCMLVERMRNERFACICCCPSICVYVIFESMRNEKMSEWCVSVYARGFAVLFCLCI